MKIGELFVEIGTKLDKFNKGMSDVQKSMQNIGRKLSAVGKQLTMKVTLPIVALGAASVKAFADFDKSMTESTAIMGKLSDSVKKDMADLAKTISTQTTFSAKELAAAYFYLASAGMDAQQSMKALGEVARFAQAGAFDLSTATDLLTDAQTALGLSSKNAAENQKNLVRVGDVLVKANTLANASVQQFAEALTSKAAAALVNVNKEVEEGVAVLAAYADKGIKGTLAGERLTMMLNGLFAATQQNKKAWDAVGISLFDAKGEMRDFGDIIGDMEVLLGSMTTEQKQATLAQLGFNVRTKDSILTLIGSSEKIKQWTKDLRDAGGTMREVSDKQMESFSNKMTVLKNKLVLIGIEFGEKLAPTIEKIILKIEKAAKWFSNLSDSTKETIIQVGLLFAALGPVLSILGKILIVVPKLAKAFKFLATSPMGLVITGLALITAKAIEARKEFEKSMKLYQREMEITGKKTSWFAKTWNSVSTAIEKTTTRLDINKIALLGYNEEQRKAQGVMTIVKRTAWALSGGVKLLGEKWQALVDILPRAKSGIKGAGEAIKKASKPIIEQIKLLKTLPNEARNAYLIMSRSAVNFQERTLTATYQWGDSYIRVIRNTYQVLAQAQTELKERTFAILEKTESKWEEVSQRIKDAWIQGLSDMLRKATTWKEGMKAIFESLDRIISDVVAKNIVNEFSKMFDKMKKKAQTCIGTSGTIAGGASDSLAGGFWAFAIFVSSKLIPRVLEDMGNLFADIISKAKYTGDVISREMLRATEGIAGKEGRKQVNEAEWFEKLLALLDKIPAALSVLIKNLNVTAKGFLGLGRIATLSLSAMMAKGRGLLDSLKAMKEPLEALMKKYRDAGKEIPNFLKPFTNLMDKMKIHPQVFESLDAAMTILESLSGVGVLTGDAFRTLSQSATTFAQKILGVTGNLDKMIDGLNVTKEQAQMLLPIIAKFVSAAAAFGLPVPKWMKSIVTQKLGIDWDKFVKQVADPAKATNTWLDKIHIKTGMVWNILNNMLPNIQTEIREGLRPLKSISFGASGISETVSSPTLYMAGERGPEHVNITPLGQSGLQPNLSIESSPVSLYLDGEKIADGMIKHLSKLSKRERFFINPNAVRAT